MKQCVRVVVISGILLFNVAKVSAQSFELQQLILDVEKLMQFKQILADMKSGYEILTLGYKAVKDISEGNFSLHKTFLDGLLEVSPAVKQYKKIGEIVSMQLDLVKNYKSSWSRFATSDLFKEGELDYISLVYDHLFQLSLKNLESLTTILTAGKLRMNDEQRLQAIDNIYAELENELQFLRSFNQESIWLLIQRGRERDDAQTVERMYFDK